MPQFIAVEARRAERSLNPDAIDLNFQGMACLNKGQTSENMAKVRIPVMVIICSGRS